MSKRAYLYHERWIQLVQAFKVGCNLGGICDESVEFKAELANKLRATQGCAEAEDGATAQLQLLPPDMVSLSFVEAVQPGPSWCSMALAELHLGVLLSLDAQSKARPSCTVESAWVTVYWRAHTSIAGHRMNDLELTGERRRRRHSAAFLPVRGEGGDTVQHYRGGHGRQQEAIPACLRKHGVHCGLCAGPEYMVSSQIVLISMDWCWGMSNAQDGSNAQLHHGILVQKSKEHLSHPHLLMLQVSQIKTD
eukprot:1142023-Pelagomonas_calceolata.AAC.1